MSNAIPIVDAHVHLWDPEHLRMSWTDGDALLNQAYLFERYREHTKNLSIAAIIFMECGVEPQYAFLEAQWAVRCARQNALLQGVVAAAPVEFGLCSETYLKALVELGPVVKGVRRNIQDEQEIGFCLQPAFVQGVQLATTYQFTFDLCIRHRQLPAVTELVRRCPKTLFMLDHLGKPPVRIQALDPWRQHIRELATLPNVFCKISGLVTEADPTTWDEQTLAPYILHIWESFGEDRVVFAGDWPVMLSASSYKRWVETLQILAASLSPTAQRKFWLENARRFYRLDTSDTKKRIERRIA